MMGDSGGSRSAAAPLLERDEQLGRIEALIASAAGSNGRIVTITGGPGEGKTALVRRCGEIAHEAGLLVLQARGRELERTFSFGVARQLLEPAVGALEPAARSELFTGPAGVAATVLGFDAERTPAGPFAATHGLYWLLAGLADRRPLLLSVDDLHWSDPASVEWLAYLRDRIEHVPVLAILAIRPGETDPTSDALADMLADPGVERLRVGPLAEASVGTLAHRHLQSRPDGEFTLACHRATSGNPFAVVELLRELREADTHPTALAAAGLAQHAPEEFARIALRRLGRLDSAATKVAQAVATIGDGAAVRDVGLLAELTGEQTAQAIDALTAAVILSAGAELRFAHPLLRAAVYGSMPARYRAACHARAGRLLAASRTDPERAAAQFLLADPAADALVVRSLRNAASLARRRGAPAAAARYLRRALREPPLPAELGGVLGEVGQAELEAAESPAAEHLTQALEITVDPRQRAVLTAILSHAVLMTGDFEESTRLALRAPEELGASDPGLALRLEAQRLTMRAKHAGLTGSVEDDLPRLIELARQPREETRPLCLALAWTLSLRGRAPREVSPVLERGIDGGRFLEVEGPQSDAAAQAALALLHLEHHDRAIALTTEMMAAASDRGSPEGFLAGAVYRGVAHLHHGALATAEADLSSAMDIARQQRLVYHLPVVAAVLAAVWQELGKFEAAAKVLETLTLPAAVHTTIPGAILLEARGAGRRHRGELDRAITDLRAAGDTYEALAIRHPVTTRWRSELALALAASSPDEARALVEEELAHARAAGSARGVGIALRCAAELAPAQAREPLLNEAVATLADSPARLEFAYALVDQGADLRRRGHRTRARDPLRAGLELAHHSQAAPLIARATDELLASGARPRRPWLTGTQALTPSELRVARLVAEGRTNQEVAQGLFITTKTVKDHLTSTYRKLDIDSRHKLAAALDTVNGT